MKNLLKYLVLGIICTAFCAACNDINNNDIRVAYPEDVEMNNYTLEGTACNWNWQSIQIDTVYLINSAEELLTYISCQKDAPTVDFEKHSLLLARGGTTSGVHKIDRNLQQTSIKEYKLTVDITLEMTTVAQGWKIAVLTPKLLSSTTIELDVKQHY